MAPVISIMKALYSTHLPGTKTELTGGTGILQRVLSTASSTKLAQRTCYWSDSLHTKHPNTVYMMSNVLKLNIWLHNLYTNKSSDA